MLKEMELNNLIDDERSGENEVYCDCMPLCTDLSYDMEQSQTQWDWYEQLRALRIPEHEELKKQ